MGFSEWPAGGLFSVNPVCGPTGRSGLLETRAIAVLGSHAASGQISAKSSRGRVIGGVLALSRQRSLNRSSAFSTTMASHHAGHRLSALASTRWPISMSSQSLGSDWPLAAGFAATVLSCFAWPESFR